MQKVQKIQNGKTGLNEARVRKYLFLTLKHLVLVLVAIVILVPFYIMLTTSFKTIGEATGKFTFWPTEGYDFSNYSTIFTDDLIGITLPKSFLNTLFVSIVPTLVGVFMSSLSAFGFAKLKFAGKKTIFGILIGTMMIPSCITMSTSFMIYNKLHWVNTPLPLIVPFLFGGIGTVFFLRQYMLGIPDSLLEAARIDGLSNIRIFLMIVLPLSVPAVTAQMIIMFIGRYNDYLAPLIYLQEPEWYTLQIALKQFSSGGNFYNKPLIATACVISVMPLLLIYIFAQNTILSGISMTAGLKS